MIDGGTAVISPSKDADAHAARQIDGVLSSFPDDKRAALQALRETIAAAAPDAVEGISYGLPAFRYRGRPLVSYNATKGHCAFFPMSPAVLDRHRDELTGFDLAKGTVRFSSDRQIPAEIVSAIVRERMTEIEGSTKASTTKKRD
jgi:uncharacterized protein YdhG (YjbR/CyaY superfamily)